MKKLSLILLALMAFGPLAWAQTMYPAGNESQLNAAIGNCTTPDDYINVTDNITLTSPLSIPAGKTITINLGGHTLQRNLNSATQQWLRYRRGPDGQPQPQDWHRQRRQ